jgi:hypothetical protein
MTVILNYTEPPSCSRAVAAIEEHNEKLHEEAKTALCWLLQLRISKQTYDNEVINRNEGIAEHVAQKTIAEANMLGNKKRPRFGTKEAAVKDAAVKHSLI